MRRAEIFLGLALLCAATPAHAQLFGTQGLDPAYCKQPTLRQTVVYVDDEMRLRQPDWARKLAEKLRATLTPGESVAVVALSPADGTSSEIWTGCWPNLGDAARAEAAAGTYVFSRSPLDQIGDQQRFFVRDLGLALTKIATDARPVQPSDGHRHKQLLRALASDGGRFANAEQTVRAIIYSDMAEDSDLGSVYAPLPADRMEFGDKLGAHLRHGVFYAYGMADGLRPEDGLPERMRAFWTRAFASMSGVAAGLGSDLNVPNVLPVRATTIPIELKLGDDALTGRVSLLADTDGTLVDSWIGVSRLSIAKLSGTFRCAPSASTCRLDAATATGFVTSGNSDQFVMTGHDAATLVGSIGVKGTGYWYPVKAVAE